MSAAFIDWDKLLPAFANPRPEADDEPAIDPELAETPLKAPERPPVPPELLPQPDTLRSPARPAPAAQSGSAPPPAPAPAHPLAPAGPDPLHDLLSSFTTVHGAANPRDAVRNIVGDVLATWTTEATAAALVIGTLWLVLALFGWRRSRQSRARSSGKPQGRPSRQLEQEEVDQVLGALQTTLTDRIEAVVAERLQVAVQQKVGAMQDGLQAKFDEKVKKLAESIQTQHNAAVDDLRLSLDDRIQDVQDAVRDKVQTPLQQYIDDVDGLREDLEQRLRDMEETVRLAADKAAVDGLRKGLQQQLEELRETVRLMPDKAFVDQRIEDAVTQKVQPALQVHIEETAGMQRELEEKLEELHETVGLLPDRAAVDQRIEEVETRNQAALQLHAERLGELDKTVGQLPDKAFTDQRIQDIVGNGVRNALQQHIENTNGVRKEHEERLKELEVTVRMMPDKASSDSLHMAMNQRIEQLEEGVRIIDGKQLDQEAMNVSQRTLSHRIDKTEEELHNLDNRTRATNQRIEATDDSIRVIDTRAKALSLRIEAAEDSVNTIDGRVTLLEHDVGRGSTAVEKLQRTVKMLPDNDKLTRLTRASEARFKKLEDRIEGTQAHLNGEIAKREEVEAARELTVSAIDVQEIEPCGPLYTEFVPPDFVFPGSPPPSTPGSRQSSYSRSYSTLSEYSGSTVIKSPHSDLRKRIPEPGFRDTTFASRQRLSSAKSQSMTSPSWKDLTSQIPKRRQTESLSGRSQGSS